ncbi:aldehyde ferredoxin oxidoreductase C-terminal domain-containing protein, partial [Chloroflexota bacterium]
WFINNPQPRMLHEKGTAGLVLLNNATGQLPTRNFREGVFEGAEKISGERMQQSIVRKMDGCYACPLACMPRVKVKGTYSVDPAYGGPQYEALAMLGSNCGIDNLEALAKAHEFCNANSLDVISAGATVSYAMECFEKGILTEKDTGGLSLKFGNADAMLRLLKMIVERQGIGDLLAEGTKRASEHIGHGSEDWALQVKGQEVAAGEPRVDFGMGLGYAVSCTGADHGKGFAGLWYASPGPSFEKFKTLGILEPIPLNDLSPARLRACKYLSSWRSFLDSSHMCSHLGYVYSFNQMAEMVNAVTGWNSSVFELLNVGERAETMARAFNAREGITRARDVLPERFFDPLPAGPAKGSKMDRDQLNEAVLTWYKMMGWDPTTGKPLPEKLDELDIGWVKALLR